MSLPGQRDRSSEANELERARRRKRGLCELCAQPAGGRNRCPDCYRKINQATERYVGQPRKGRMTKIGEDIVDLNYALEALGKAMRGFAQVSEADEENPRRRREMLIEHRAQVSLARRFLGDVLKRNPEQPERPRLRVVEKPVQLVFRFYIRQGV